MKRCETRRGDRGEGGGILGQTCSGTNKRVNPNENGRGRIAELAKKTGKQERGRVKKMDWGGGHT